MFIASRNLRLSRTGLNALLMMNPRLAACRPAELISERTELRQDWSALKRTLPAMVRACASLEAWVVTDFRSAKDDHYLRRQ